MYVRTVPAVFERQIEADSYSGYDFIGYHNYARRRYSEIVRGEDEKGDWIRVLGQLQQLAIGTHNAT